MTAIFRIFNWRIILNRFSFDGRHFTSTIQCLKACWTLPKACTMRPGSSHKGTCRCNLSLGLVSATFLCVCKCCDFLSATCPRYTPLLRVASMCTKQVFVAVACRCDMSLQHDPSCLPTLRRHVAGTKSQICTHVKMLWVHVPGILCSDMSPHVN